MKSIYFRYQHKVKVENGGLNKNKQNSIFDSPRGRKVKGNLTWGFDLTPCTCVKSLDFPLGMLSQFKHIVDMCVFLKF